MNNTDCVKILKKMDVTDLSGEKVMIDFETGKYFMIKGAGNEIWDMLEDGICVQTVIDQLMQIYEVEEKKCTQAVYQFLENLIKNQIITIEAKQ